MKGLEGIGLFTDTDELDGLAGDVANGESCAAAGVAVHFCQDYSSQSETSMKIECGVDGVLAGHGVGYEEDFLRVEELFEALHFLHQLFVDVKTACGIDDERVKAEVAGFASRFARQALDECGAGLLAFEVAFVDFGVNGFGDDFELLAGGGTVDVNGDEKRTAATFF